MKRTCVTVFVCALVAGGLAVNAQENAPKRNKTISRTENSVRALHVDRARDAADQRDDEAAIIENAVTYVRAFDSKNSVALAKLWAPNAVHVQHDTGERSEGREAIAAAFRRQFEESPQVKLQVHVKSIHFVTSDVAVEDGTATVISDDDEPSESTYTAVHVKRDGQWLIDSVRETETPPPAHETVSAPPRLAELEWMVGEWVDESEDSTVETVCRWTKNNKFLTRTFKVSAPGVDTLEGTQVIGWDPRQRQLRSWIFDSDGGYLEGTIAHSGNTWTVSSSGFLDDGSLAQSVGTVEYVDDDHFLWSSSRRAVDGQPLPNIPPVSVVRKPAVLSTN